MGASSSKESEGTGTRTFAEDDLDIFLTIPADPVASRDACIELQHSSNYHTMIQNAGLNDILSFIRVIECKPDNLQFQGQADVKVRYRNVPENDKFVLLGQEAGGTWQDMSKTCSPTRSFPWVSFKLQHFSKYILVAVVGSVALPSAIKLFLDCLNGRSFPCSFTPYLGKVSGKKHPLTIVCKEGCNVPAPTPETYQMFGLVRTSEFNIFDEERLTIEIRHADLVEKCSESYQINRAICGTQKGQAMDMIVKPDKPKGLLAGQAEIFVCRFFKEKKVCSLNLTIIEEESPPSPHRPHHEHHETGVRKYFYFIKEKVSSEWKDLAFFLGFDRAGIDNIAGRNRDDKTRCKDMLEEWQRSRGASATVDVLLEALSKAGQTAVVDGLKIRFPEIQALFGASGWTRTDI